MPHFVFVALIGVCAVRYFVRFELPGVTGGEVQTPATVEEDDSCSFVEPLVGSWWW